MDPDGVLGRARLPLDRSDHCSSSIAVWSFSAKMTTKTFHYDYLIIWAVFDYCSFAALSRLTFTGICQQPQRIHFTGGADPRDQSPTRESQGIALRSYGAARRTLCCCQPARIVTSAFPLCDVRLRGIRVERVGTVVEGDKIEASRSVQGRTHIIHRRGGWSSSPRARRESRRARGAPTLPK